MIINGAFTYVTKGHLSQSLPQSGGIMTHMIKTPLFYHLTGQTFIVASVLRLLSQKLKYRISDQDCTEFFIVINTYI